MIVFGIYLTKHPQHGDRFQIQIRNTVRGDGSLKVFGIFGETPQQWRFGFPDINSNTVRGGILFQDVDVVDVRRQFSVYI